MRLFVMVLVLLGLMLAVYLNRRTIRRSGPDTAVPTRGRLVSFPRPGHAVAILPARADPPPEAAGRLVDELAMSVLASCADVQEVTVRTHGGRVLGSRRRARPREKPGATSPEPLPGRSRDGPADRSAPEPAGRRGGLRRSGWRHGHRPEGVALPVPRSLADRLELPTPLRAGLADPDSPADVVEGLLRAAGHHPERAGNLLRLEDHGLVVLVLDVPAGSMVSREDLNRAHLRYRNSGGRRGLVVAAGYFPARDIARRQAVDPTVLHAGFRDLQRMADAAVAGTDPLESALSPRTSGDLGQTLPSATHTGW